MGGSSMVFQHTGHSKAARGKIGFDVAILLEPDWQTSEVKRLDQKIVKMV